ncbi:MAG: GNAT family N-acetyltransferase [Lachnospiraceae bacterium]|nr:GNAT family N-acetyltransferase [Lachnospiraceae bacterium]
MQYSYIPTQIGRTLRLKVYLVDGDKKVGHSLISSTNNTWTITGWYIDEEYQNKGLGKELLHNSFTYLYNLFGTPNKIDYIWNGTNEYVIEWLRSNFSPISKCPIAVQKTQADDDWESHIYTLDKDKVLIYFNIIGANN